MDSKIKCGVYANSLQQIALGIHFNPTLHKFPASTSYPNGLGLVIEFYRFICRGIRDRSLNRRGKIWCSFFYIYFQLALWAFLFLFI